MPDAEPGSLAAGLDYQELREVLAAREMLGELDSKLNERIAAVEEGRREPGGLARVAALAVERMEPGPAQAST